jgi:hypothetical protein
MMKLEQLFDKPVDRPIEGVIKADDDASLRLELDEYVITDEVGKRLDNFLDAYLNYSGANGVWISGFFGSGKSHLLKMLALLLENRIVDGTDALSIFLAKPKCSNDEIFANDLKRAVTIPSQSILFNIDQKADVISKTELDALIAVFVKVFDEHCGYYGKQAYIAQFERDLEADGLLEQFKETFQSKNSMDWDKGRQRAKRMGGAIDESYNEVSGQVVNNILDKYRSDYRLSIEDFAEQVNTYISKQEKGFRLNFFVDEVGQYIAGNVKLMTNLQTVAESLATKCHGQAWVIVTAQEDMSTVVGETGKQQSNDFTKIQARFKNRMKLTSQDVAEVIQIRLLHKKEEFIPQLTDLYHAQENNFKTLFDFADGSQSFRNYRDKENFIQSYPFVPYQFSLFQAAIQNLSTHNAFEGKHSSVGERSMLGVFQQVAIAIKNHGIGELATFDLMFEGIRTALKTAIQQSILKAEKQLDNVFAVHLLKALFLVKYVKEFKPTIRNLCVLMHDSFDRDIPSLKVKIEEALSLLEKETYIQRNGELYEYLTDEEQDIEQEIKNTEIDSQKVSDELEKLIYEGVLKTRKIRFDENNHDYSYSRRLDDTLTGREYELAINVITSFHDYHDAIEKHKADTVFSDELRILLPASERLVRDLIMYKRTERYIAHETRTVQQESIKRILDDKRHLNMDRLNDLKTLCAKLVGTARFFVAGQELEFSGEDGQSKMLRAFHELIKRTYPNLRMLRGVQYTETQITDILKEAGQGLFTEDTSLPESQQEVLSFIQSNSRGGVRTTVKSLLDKFETKPYGWSFAAVLCSLAYLCVRCKVEIRESTNLLDDADLVRALRNTAAHGNLILDPQVEFSPSQLRWVKEFYNDYFEKMAHATEAKALAKEVQVGFETQAISLDKLLGQTEQYPFLRLLSPIITDLQELKGKPYTWIMAELKNQEDRWFDHKEKTIDPIVKFMKGPSKATYDDAKKLLSTEKPNLTYLKISETESKANEQIDAALQDPDVYKGSHIQQLKTLIESLTAQLADLLKQEQQIAVNSIEALEAKLKSFDQFQSLSNDQQEELLKPFEDSNKHLTQQTLVAVIRDEARRFEDETYSALVQRLMIWSRPAQKPKPAKPEPTPRDEVRDDECKEEQENPRYEEVPEQAEPVTVKAKHLQVNFSKPCLETEADVNAYLEEYKKVLIGEIEAGKQIQL